jgi:hypothetical protein
VTPWGVCKCYECSTSTLENTVVFGLQVVMARNSKYYECFGLTFEESVGENMKRILSTDAACLIELTTWLRLCQYLLHQMSRLLR